MNLKEVVVAGAGALPERRVMRPDVLAQSAGAMSSTGIQLHGRASQHSHDKPDSEALRWAGCQLDGILR